MQKIDYLHYFKSQIIIYTEKGVIMENELGKKLFAEDSLLYFEEEQVKNAISSLENYISLMQNNNRLFESGVDITLTGEYNDFSLKRSSLIKSKAENVFFINTALTGSYFSEVSFSDSNVDESNMQYCQFIHCVFNHVNIHSSNLSYSNFFNTTFEHIDFKGSTVSEILFEQCQFKQCTFSSSMLENAVFVQCTFSSVKFVNTNIEYMEFKNCEFSNVTFPMAQVSYVFGLLQSMAEPGNDILLSADNKTVSLDEYETLKESFIIYYTSISEYFPLTNIYLSRGELENAYNCIVFGMERAIIQRNFRMLKFFCKLAKQKSVFPYNKLKELYMLLEKYVSKQHFNIYEQRSFIYNIGEIRSILLEDMYDFPTARISLQTNVDSSESSKIIQIIEYIDSAINKLCTQKLSHIEYHHNSDANFVIQLSANYFEITLLIGILLKFSSNIVDDVQKKILNHQQIKMNKLLIEQNKKKLKDLEDENKQLKQNNIQYKVQFIINNPTTNSNDINIYL